MKKSLHNVLLLCATMAAAFAAKAQNYCESNATGELQSNIWTCHGTATRPTISSFNGDSLVVKHTVSWGTAPNEIIDLSSSQMKLLSVRPGGKIGPAINNNELIIPTNAVIKIYSGASISPLSGNNSNHAVEIGSVCIWGKKCCSGNNTINGPIQMNASFPCGFTALPVELISFTGKTLDGARIFNWKTAMETNVSNYTIEESVDGQSWKMVGVIPSKGNSSQVTEYNYTLTEFSQAPSTAYRLVQNEYTGEKQVLKTISMLSQTGGTTVVTQTQNGVNVFVNPDIEKVNITVCDLYGKKIYVQSGVSNNGNIDIVLSDIASGMYIVNITNAGDQSVLATQKIVLQ